MKNIPQNFIYDGHFNVILFRIDDTNPIWISDKNINSIIGENNYLLFNDILPIMMNNREYKYLSQIKLNIDIENNKYFQNESNFHLTILRKEGLDEIISSNLLGKIIEIYIGVIDENKNIIKDELFLFQACHISQIQNINHIFKRISFSIGDVMVNKIIPRDMLNKNDYINLPDNNIGKSIPILYGRFCLTDELNEEFDLAPAIMIDEYENIYLGSNHKIYNSSYDFYLYNSSIKRYVKIISEVEFENNDKAKIRPDYMMECEGIFRLKKMGNLTSNSMFERYLEHINNKTTLQILSQESLFLSSDEIAECGYLDYYYNGLEFGTIKIIISFGSVINGNGNIAGKVKYYLNGEFFTSSNNITANDSNICKEILMDIPIENFFRQIKNIQFGITSEQNAIIEFKKMCVCIKFNRK